MPSFQIKVLDKAIRILELLAQSNRGIRLKDLISTASLNKSTALRILRALESHELAARDGSGAFVLGSRVLWWENCYRRNFELLAVARPVLEKLRDLTGETVTFSILMGQQTVVIDQVVSRNVTSTRFELGLSAPLHAGASGKVILAHMSQHEQKKFLRSPHLRNLTEQTITSRVELERELRKCRVKGFTVSRGERTPNTCSIAAPVLARAGEVAGVISIVGPTDRLRQTALKSIAPVLVSETRALGEQIRRALVGNESTAHDSTVVWKERQRGRRSNLRLLSATRKQ
jgi:IclR family acetate operon transcriptional repressor